MGTNVGGVAGPGSNVAADAGNNQAADNNQDTNAAADAFAKGLQGAVFQSAMQNVQATEQLFKRILDDIQK